MIRMSCVQWKKYTDIKGFSDENPQPGWFWKLVEESSPEFRLRSVCPTLSWIFSKSNTLLNPCWWIEFFFLWYVFILLLLVILQMCQDFWMDQWSSLHSSRGVSFSEAQILNTKRQRWSWSVWLVHTSQQGRQLPQTSNRTLKWNFAKQVSNLFHVFLQFLPSNVQNVRRIESEGHLCCTSGYQLWKCLRPSWQCAEDKVPGPELTKSNSATHEDHKQSEPVGFRFQLCHLVLLPLRSENYECIVSSTTMFVLTIHWWLYFVNKFCLMGTLRHIIMIWFDFSGLNFEVKPLASDSLPFKFPNNRKQVNAAGIKHFSLYVNHGSLGKSQMIAVSLKAPVYDLQLWPGCNQRALIFTFCTARMCPMVWWCCNKC